jgi:hypothetical protein
MGFPADRAMICGKSRVSQIIGMWSLFGNIDSEIEVNVAATDEA